jgi:hypothetical protein
MIPLTAPTGNVSQSVDAIVAFERNHSLARTDLSDTGWTDRDDPIGREEFRTLL